MPPDAASADAGEVRNPRAGLLRVAAAASAVLVSALLIIASTGLATAQRIERGERGEDRGPASRPIQPLKGFTPLEPVTGDIIIDPLAAQQLGKALFWDTQIGSDGTACASCHFHAGADIRVKNQVSPGVKAGIFSFATRFRAEGRTGPNAVLDASDFPFHRLADPRNRESDIVFDTTDIFGSQGNFSGDLVSSARPALKLPLQPGVDPAIEPCGTGYNPYDPKRNPKGSPFHANQMIFRQVEARHTPTVVNAVFNMRQFWDGRANTQFNGVDPFGPRTYTAATVDLLNTSKTIGNPFAAGLGILVAADPASGGVLLEQPLIGNSSLASQSLGAPLSDFEIACGGKSFADIARKLGPVKPLSSQVVDPTDSVFGKTPDLVNALKLAGLNTTYQALVQKAFNPRYWAADGKYVVDPVTGAIKQDAIRGATQFEYNFSLFWGLALQSYQALLISDDAPFDRGPDAMSASALRGQQLFAGRANCTACHNGPVFSSAAWTAEEVRRLSAVDTRLMGDGYPALIDSGFANTGVRPTKEDRGLGGTDPYGFDLSFTRQHQLRLAQRKSRAPDKFVARPCVFTQRIAFDCEAIDEPDDDVRILRDAVDGAFKVPTLRNVGLKPPYFHNGGQSNLKDVVRFYNRGGDRRGSVGNDTTGLAVETAFGLVNKSNIDPNIGDPANRTGNNGLGLTENEMDDIVQFMMSLTDQRVACHSGVFDHPELPLVIGQRDTARGGSQRARDIVATLPAIGQNGFSACLPNTGDLFGTLSTTDTRKLSDVFGQILQIPQ